MSHVVPRSEPAPMKQAPVAGSGAGSTVVAMLAALSLSHLLNDTIQSLLPAIYPLLKEAYHLSFAQIGLITFTNQVTASLLQPVVGSFTDRRPQPFSLAIGMGFTLAGLVLLAVAGSFGAILGAAVLIGSVRRFSIRRRRGSPSWRRAGGMASRNRSSRSAAISALRSGRCWRR